MLRILDITAPDINNGIGIRVTLWVAGCTHKCKGCHNPWTWNFNQGKDFIEEQDYILSKLEDWLSRDYVDGITFSGGDPLCQDKQGLESLLDIIQWVRSKFPTKTIWLYTGYVYVDLMKEIYEYENNDRFVVLREILKNIDVLVDGPYKEELRDIAHCPFRGSTNQRLIYLNNGKREDK